MAHVEYWLQLENHPWDVMPNGVNRLTGETLTRNPNGFFSPLPADALIFRRYSANWQAPDDHPLNSWDLTEPDPAATNGTIPGATLEFKVGDDIIVHFRNMDQRAGLSPAERTHSFHAHGLSGASVYDGAYPFSSPDPAQGGKRGDRVAPGDSFDYRFTVMNLSNAGAWFYYDHSRNRKPSIRLGAFGAIVVRAGGEGKPDLPASALRRAGDSPSHFAALPPPAMRPEYLVVFHELDGAGVCLNGRQGLGNTSTFLGKLNSRLKFRVMNLCDSLQVFQLHGHRWQVGSDWVDSQDLAPMTSMTFETQEGSLENGGSDGEWFLGSARAADTAVGSLLLTNGGQVSLETGAAPG